MAFWIKEVLIEVDIFEEKYYTHKIHNQRMIKALTKNVANENGINSMNVSPSNAPLTLIKQSIKEKGNISWKGTTNT